MLQPWIVDLAQIGPEDRRRLGSKACNLGLLSAAGFLVSPGFCLSTDACRSWSPAVREALLAAYRRLGGGAVAVRSSAIEEDGDTASYAGIYCSELPVEGETALVAAVERCLNSWHDRRASEYRSRHGDGDEFSLALLVQRLVPAIAAGVAYTCDPLQPKCRDIHINAIWGLAEPLAAGRVDADSFVLSRRGRLLRQSIAEKHSRLTAHGPRAVAAEHAHTPCLSPADARRVAQLALRAEAFFGPPQDVEFAVTADGPWIVQSRPIVAPPPAADLPLDRFLTRERLRLARKFGALRRHGTLRGREVVLSNGNVGEILVTPTLASFGLFQRLFCGPAGAIFNGRRRLGYCFDPRRTAHFLEMVGGQVYFNLEIDAVTFDYGASPPIEHYLDRVIADPALANYPELNLYCQHFTPEEARQCFGPAQAEEALRRSDEFHQAMLRKAADFLERYRGGRPASAPGMRETSASAIAKRITKRIRSLRSGLCVEFVIAARLGFYFAAQARKRLLGWLGSAGEGLYAPLLSGLPGSLVTEEALDLERVLAGQLSREEFLAAYGHTSENELELSEPRLDETPERLDTMLRDLAASGRSPAADFARQQCQRIEAEAALDGRLAAVGIAIGERAALGQELYFAQRLLPLRESIKHHYTAAYADIRRDLLRLAASLGWEESLIFQLHPREIPRAAQDPERWLPIAELRRTERGLARAAARRRLLPNVIFGSCLDAIGQPASTAGAEGWRGQGISPGRAWGIARVIEADSPAGNDGDFSGDEILILRAANLGVAPLFRLVAGVVVEVGGLLAHSACQAREAGIPAVLLPGATACIADGSRLMIDGTAGSIHLLPPETSRGSHDFLDEDLAAV